MGQSTVTTQTNFEVCIAEVGNKKVFIQQNEMGFDVNDMRGNPMVRVWDAGDDNGIQVEVLNGYLRNQVPSTSPSIMIDPPSSLHDEIPELPDIEFIAVSTLNDLSQDRVISS